MDNVRAEYCKYIKLVCLAGPELILVCDKTFADDRYTVDADETRVKVVSGGIRGLYYGIYGYFEQGYGVKWFWDGDRLPKIKTAAPTLHIDVTPCYKLRGMRYFAHRGLKRFRAEMWDEADWKREIDYLLKKGYNFFMLRIGQDDLWQKAFPEYCPYPDTDAVEDKESFYDRTQFWSLRRRGEIRKSVLAYAKERGLIFPTDCGTMTHWYSPTPQSFLDGAKPIFLSQSIGLYGSKELSVFDVRIKRNMDFYLRLTDTEVNEYGNTGLFHTIGLAERLFSDDRNENLKLKKQVYTSLLTHIGERYPGSKLLIAGWDLSMYWTPDEVKQLVSELDADKAIIFDYTTDSDEQKGNFRVWGVKDSFPYMVGLIHAYAPQDDMRGDIDFIEQRLKGTQSDIYCKGLVTWQELSHGDGLMLSYLANKCTHGGEISSKDVIKAYCDETFGDNASALEMLAKLYPVAKLERFRFNREHPEYNFSRYYFVSAVKSDYGYNLDFDAYDDKQRSRADFYLPQYEAVKSNIKDVVSLAISLYAEYKDDTHAARALYDVMRTAVARYLHFEMINLQKLYFTGGNWSDKLQNIKTVLSHYTDLLGTHTDYVAADTYDAIAKSAPVNPNYETSFKHSISSDYCIGNCYETLKLLSLPQMDLLQKKLSGAEIADDIKSLYAAFYSTPLKCVAKQDKTFEICGALIKNLLDF